MNSSNEQKSRTLVILFTAIVLTSIFISFVKFFVLRDYPIQSQIECDPYTEACYIYVCDPTVEECTGDPAQDTSYYKLIDRNAKNIPLCNPLEEGCMPLECPAGEEGCVITTCDASVEGEGVCIDPVEYSRKHPKEEETTSEIE